MKRRTALRALTGAVTVVSLGPLGVQATAGDAQIAAGALVALTASSISLRGSNGVTSYHLASAVEAGNAAGRLTAFPLGSELVAELNSRREAQRVEWGYRLATGVVRSVAGSTVAVDQRLYEITNTTRVRDTRHPAALLALSRVVVGSSVDVIFRVDVPTGRARLIDIWLN